MTQLRDLYSSLDRSIYKVDSYLDFYESHFSVFRNKPITFVEIGVFGGGSLELWKKYFHPDSRIIGLDLNQDAYHYVPEGVEFFQLDQENPKEWLQFFEQIGPVDLVVDDGGHLDRQQITTINEVIPRLNPGGMLVVEDLFFSYRKNQGNPSKYSCIEYIKKLIDELNLQYIEFTNETDLSSSVATQLETISLGNSIASFQKKTSNAFRYFPNIIEREKDSKSDFRDSKSQLRNNDKSLSKFLINIYSGFKVLTRVGNSRFVYFVEARIKEKLRVR